MSLELRNLSSLISRVEKETVVYNLPTKDCPVIGHG